MDIQKKYRRFVGLFSLLGLATFAYYCYRLIFGGSPKDPIIGLIPVAVMAVGFRVAQGYFYRRGYYSKKQAERFYERCDEEKIIFITSGNMDTVRKIYSEEVYQMTPDELKKIKERELYQNILALGKNLKGEK